MTGKKIDISIIIINYNSLHYLKPCLESIKKYIQGIECEILIVDNNSKDDSVANIKKYYPEIILIENSCNAGFGFANNQAAKIAKGDYLFLLNADTLLVDNKIDEVIDFARKNDIAIVGPRLVSENGGLQRSWDEHNNISRHILNILSMALFINKLGGSKRCNIIQKPQSVKFLVGAAMLIDRRCYDELDLFDEQFFFTGEERDLCMRYAAAGKKMCYYPGWTVLHYGGSGDSFSYFHLINWIKSSIRLAGKHGNFIQQLFMKLTFTIFLFSYMFAFKFKSLLESSNEKKNLSLRFRKILLWHLGFKRESDISK